MVRIFRHLAVFLSLAAALAGCPAASTGPAGIGAGSNPIDAPAEAAPSPSADSTAAEPKPLPGGIVSPGVDLNDPEADPIAWSSVQGTYTNVCVSQETSKYRVEGEIVTKWTGGGESCMPLFGRSLVSVVMIGVVPRWTLHSVGDDCKFSDVIETPEFGPRTFYLVKCEGFVCKPKDGDLPLPSDLKALFSKTPPPCLEAVP